MKHELLNKPKQKTTEHYPGGRSWKQAVNFLSLALVIIFGFFSIVATGGGSSTTTSGEVSALTLPGRIELSKTDGSGAGGASIKALGGFLGMAFDDPETDYTNQEKEVWVDDTDALDMVNSILGVCKETAYQNFVNQGPYKALAKPVSESEQSQGGSSTSSSATESLMEVTLDVTRASNSDPMIIKIWVEESDGPGDMPMLIRGYFEVSAGVSAQYPYGLMEAHFKGNALNPDGSEGDQLFTMAMSVGAEAGDVVIQFVEAGADGGGNCEWDNKVRVVANATVTEGNAYVYEYENSVWDGEDEDTAYYAFNENYLKEKFVGEPEEVLDKNDFEYIVYRYKLFRHDDGSVVTRNSGFPIQLAGGENAYIGYYGLWAPYGIETNNGDAVTRPDTGEEYTLVKKGGKLKKHTKNQITVSELDGVEMSYWEDPKDYVITWNADPLVQKFEKIGERDQQTGQIAYYGEPVQIESLDEWDGAWCEALNAYLPLGRLYAGGGTPDNADTLSYHAEEVVSPATVEEDMTLYYWGFALDAPIDQTDIDNAAANEQAYWAGAPVEKTYTFSATDLALKDGDGDPVIIDAGLDLSESIYTWGYNMMPLVTEPLCPDPWNEETYYSWETGPNEWNQYATVKDAYGDYEVFDAPLRLTYTHATANDINDDPTHDDKVFNLEYDGFELRIPWEFDDDAGDWQPMINLKDGTVLSADGTNYVVKGIEVGLDLQEAPEGAGDDLIIDEGIEPPTLTYDASKTALVGDRPADAELKVIKGEII
jgi:hypothetical protein